MKILAIIQFMFYRNIVIYKLYIVYLSPSNSPFPPSPLLEHAFIESKALLWLWSCETWVTCQGLPPPAHILRGPQTVVKMLQTWPDGWYQKFAYIKMHITIITKTYIYIYIYINVSAHSAYILLLNVFDTTRESFQKQKGTKGRAVNGKKTI